MCVASLFVRMQMLLRRMKCYICVLQTPVGRIMSSCDKGKYLSGTKLEPIMKGFQGKGTMGINCTLESMKENATSNSCQTTPSGK